MLKLLKLSKLAKRTGMSTTISRKVSRDSWTAYRESSPGGANLSSFLRSNFAGAIHSGRAGPGSLSGIIESKESAEWWNMISDENCEWTDSPKHQES